MTMLDNRQIVDEIENVLVAKLPIKLGVNKKNELIRLVYEISLGGNRAIQEVLDDVDIDRILEDGKGELFFRVKKKLLEIRYPSFEKDDKPHIMPVKPDAWQEECQIWDSQIQPHNIYIEESVCDLKWTEEFLQNFPNAKHVEIGSLKEGIHEASQSDPVKMYNARRENIFLARSEHAFIKKCPCTKGCMRCGYWVLNIGFGCPIDCSYCYLQMYSNAPGIILPANIEDYYQHIEEFDNKLSSKVRIGTGEFTDSLAFDRYTGYSARLISFFRESKNLILELKTKISDIDNILEQEPHDNVVVSWSINTRAIANQYEKGSANITERIDAAVRAVQRGYHVGFHFDPLVYYDGWENDYKKVVEELFSYDEIKRNTSWISLGTLRYTPGLKQASEQRFADSLLFYQGEFFEDDDGKLRYLRDIRINMYNKMIEWIRSYDTSCWIYLCMEQKEVWDKVPLSVYEWESGGSLSL